MWEELSGSLILRRKYPKEYYDDLLDDFKKDLPGFIIDQTYDLGEKFVYNAYNAASLKISEKDFESQKSKTTRICLAYILHNKNVGISTALLRVVFYLYSTILAEEMTFWVGTCTTVIYWITILCHFFFSYV